MVVVVVVLDYKFVFVLFSLLIVMVSLQLTMQIINMVQFVSFIKMSTVIILHKVYIFQLRTN